jgi:hypothetical protein
MRDATAGSDEARDNQYAASDTEQAGGNSRYAANEQEKENRGFSVVR